jgi:hypothetical protein
MKLDDEFVTVSVVKLAILCDALHIVQKYMSMDQIKADLEKNLEDEDSFYATIFTMALFIAKDELNTLVNTKQDFLEKIRGKDYILNLIDKYSTLMGEDLKKKNGWNNAEMNEKVDEFINQNDITILERMMKAKPYEKN